MKLCCLSLVILVILAGCTGTVDVEKQKADLMEIDRTFSATSNELGAPEAFQRFMADSATMLRDRSYPITGQGAIGELFMDWPSTAQLTWEPVFADVSLSGDLGYTIGEYLYTDIDSSGNEIAGAGYYVSIWKKQADGSWKWVLDAGTQGLPSEEEQQP